jgi:hypothetical protein
LNDLKINEKQKWHLTRIYDSKTPTSNTPFFDQEKSNKKESEKEQVQGDFFS